MAATILIVVLMLAGFALSLYLKRFASSPVVFFAQLALAVYFVAAAIKAWMNQSNVLAHTTLAIIALAMVGTGFYRRAKGGRRD